MDYAIPFDTTRFVDASIKEVNTTIFEAALLVLAVVFLFLQTWRATLIPMIAVPVSLIGAFAGLWLVGFSINTLTLFALVLAIGIVVDDAIVVLENVERLMRENDMPPFEAALEAMREVSGAVVAIVLVLCAVFIPVAFLGGIAGQLYRQFAVTLTFAVVISGFIALTLTPALCAILMKKGDHELEDLPPVQPRLRLDHAPLPRRRRAPRCAHRVLSLIGFARAARAVRRSSSCACPRASCRRRTRATSSATCSCPTARRSSARARSPASCRDIAQNSPAVQNVIAINGFDLLGGGNKTNASTMFIPLKHWDERKDAPGRARRAARSCRRARRCATAW